MKTLEEILRDYPPFRAAEIGQERVHWMFMLVDGSLIEKPGCNHAELLGFTAGDGDKDTAERHFCDQNKALRVCFQTYEERDGKRGDYRDVYIQIWEVLPNETQWLGLGDLYRIKGRDGTFVRWDVYLSEEQRWNHGEGSLNDLRRLLFPRVPEKKVKKERKTEKPTVRP